MLQHFLLVSQTVDRKLKFLKRQALAALIFLSKKTNKNFSMEMNKTVIERIKRKRQF